MQKLIWKLHTMNASTFVTPTWKCVERKDRLCVVYVSRFGFIYTRLLKRDNANVDESFLRGKVTEFECVSEQSGWLLNNRANVKTPFNII